MPDLPGYGPHSHPPEYDELVRCLDCGEVRYRMDMDDPHECPCGGGLETVTAKQLRQEAFADWFMEQER